MTLLLLLRHCVCPSRGFVWTHMRLLVQRLLLQGGWWCGHAAMRLLLLV